MTRPGSHTHPDADHGAVHHTALGTLGVWSLPPVTGTDAAHEWLAQVTPRLAPPEAALASALPLARQVGFVGGRLALRTAFHALGESTPAVLRTDRGAPELPSGLLGSVSHKGHRAVALVRRASQVAITIGVDLETAPQEAAPADTERRRGDIAPRILTRRERERLEALADVNTLEYREAVRLRFALKEAVYKAIDPFVRRYVRFQEVEVFPDADGTADVQLLLPEQFDQPLTIHACWTRLDSDLIAMAVGARPTRCLMASCPR